MTVNHVGGESSWLYAVTGGNRLVVSAAEVFVLISGFAMGIVHRSSIRRDGVGAMLGRILGRAWFLYAVTVLLTIVFAAASVILGTPWAGRAAPATSAGEFVFAVLTFQRTYTLADILVLYTLLVAAAAPALWLVARGHTVFVVALSWTAWSVQQLWPERVPRVWDIVDGGFPFSAWQVLFFMGLVVGFHRQQLGRYLAPARLFVFGAAIAVALAVVHAFVPLVSSDQSAVTPVVYELLFDKHNARVGRVLAVFAFVALAYGAITLTWAPVRQLSGWLLLTIGRRALFAFGVQLFVVAFMASELMAPLRLGRDNALFQGAAVIVVWLVCVHARGLRETLASTVRGGRTALRAGTQIASLILAPALAIALVAMLTEGVTHSGRSGVGPRSSAEQVVTNAPMQYGRVEERMFHSESLERTMPVTTYLPPGYDADPLARFAVLYMLHGGHEWIDYGLIDAADQLMGSGAIAPLLIVLAQGDQEYWADHEIDSSTGAIDERWGTYVARDLVVQVDHWYRTVAQPEGRAVGGLSMGGHAAIQLPMNFPAQHTWWIEVGDADPWPDAVAALHKALTEWPAR